MNKFIFVQLNEINFELVNKYLLNSVDSKYKNLRKLIKDYKHVETFGESRYENLEPWIQWVSVNTGKEFKDHQIFRLGDITKNKDLDQIFEKIEKNGYKVGAISPMNANNKLDTPYYFIPDPWTDTSSDGSKFSIKFTKMLRQSVNDNAKGKLTITSILILLESFLRTFNMKRTFFLIRLIIKSIKRPWNKSLVLDYLIHLIHLKFFNKKQPDFSLVFFNAGAHIQHHYLFNSKYIDSLHKNPSWYVDSKVDPIADMLEVYDKILEDYLLIAGGDAQLMIATGLQQAQYDFVKYYYRLNNHKSFLKKIGISFEKVLPRMTRDFEIIFQNKTDLDRALEILKNINSIKDNLIIFNEIEIRKNSLFVTLTYPHEIKMGDMISIDGKLMNFFDEVVFVAIKNGMHDRKGYAYFSRNFNFNFPLKPIHVAKLHDIVMYFFPKKNSS